MWVQSLGQEDPLVEDGSDGKESAYNAGDPGSNPWSGRSPGERNGKPLQYSCLENPTDRGAQQTIVQSEIFNDNFSKKVFTFATSF